MCPQCGAENSFGPSAYTGRYGCDYCGFEEPAMIFTFMVAKVAKLRHRAFKPNPDDPGNTMDTGKQIEELHLEVLPDQLKGGRGYMMVQLNDADYIGTFEPGEIVEVEIRRKGGQ